MKKIIKKGNKASQQMTCPYCSCVFTYEMEDIRPPSLVLTIQSYCVSCPDCGYQIPIYYMPYYLPNETNPLGPTITYYHGGDVCSCSK